MAGFDTSDRDLTIRTVLGEAGNQGDDGMQAVANVIANRTATGKWGSSPKDVVLAKSQFEPWSSRAGELLAISPDSPGYQRAAKIVDDVFSGQADDITGGATHFYAPRAQAALGRNAPAWGTGQPLAQVGGHLFFAPNGPVNRGAAPGAIDQATRGPAMANDTKQPDDISDDELMGILTGKPTQGVTGGRSAAPGSQTPAGAQGQPAATGAPATDDLSDDALLQMLTGKGGGSSKAGGAPMVTPEGVRDSSTGELVVGGKPFTTQGESPLAAARTAVSGFLEGMPVVGPYVKSGTERGAAAIRALSDNTKFGDELGDIHARNQREAAAHPYVNTAGQVAGAVTGSIPLIAAAPGAFGLGGASLPMRSLASGATNALLAGTDAAVRSGGDPTSALHGAELGLMFGGLAPGAGKLLGAGVNKLTNSFNGVTPGARAVANVLGDVEMTPAQLRNRLTELGPSAVIADADPALTTEAGALSARGGAATSTMKRAMQTRAAGADDQASRLVEQHLGPKPDFEAVKSGIESDAATRAGPSYTAGRDGPAMDVTHILSDIDSRLPNASGGVEGVLNKVRGFLTNKVASASNPTGLDVPKSDPGSILGARQALDDMMEKMPLDTSAGKNAFRTAQSLRNDLDKVVKTNPDFAAGDAIHAKSMGIRDALNEGLDVFKKNVRPEDLQRSIQSMTPEQLAAHRQGARVAIADAMEQNRRGELAGAQSMFAKGSANRAKLDALFPNAQDALDALHSEATMRGTERQILGQSVTAERAAAMARWAPQQSHGNALLDAGLGAAMGDPTAGIATAVGRKGFNKLADTISQRMFNGRAQQAASGLVATGPEQDALLAAIERARAGNPLMVNRADAAANLLMQQAQPYRNRLVGRR